MNRTAWLAVVLASALLTPFTPIGIGVATAQEDERIDHARISQGRSLFRAWCRTCHGEAGKGDGPQGRYLTPEPANLTLLSQKNRGTYPFDEVMKKIDGTEKVQGHGSSDMPIWGKAFKKVDETATDEAVQEKVRALAFYVRSLQIAG